MRLKLSNISYHLGDNRFSYNVEINEAITGIYGPSGAGKTTLLNIIAGLDKPHSGSISFNEKPLFDYNNHINLPVNKRNLGIVFQDNYLFPHLSIKKNLNYSAPYVNGRKKYVDFNKVVTLLEIENLLDKKPIQLSGGEKQRVAIGRTLLSQPELLLFDEPFSNLDRQKRKLIISYLLKINHQFNVPLLIISHDLEDILKLTRKLLVINNGTIQTAGNYLKIAENGEDPDIISHKRFLNVFEAIFTGFCETEKLARFSESETSTETLFISKSTDMLKSNLQNGQKVRLCIHPDDIALSNIRIPEISIQNQLKGVITNIVINKGSHFVTINCGFELVAEVTQAAVEKLQLSMGKLIYCLIKSKAVEVIHTFKPENT